MRWLWLMAAVSAGLAHAQPDASFLVPREDFLRRLDLTRPELAAVKQALEANDLPRAERAFIAHWRTRPLQSPFLTDWEAIARKADYRNGTAEAALAGHFNDGYSVYDAPPTGIDWHGCPLSCVTRMPLLIAPRWSYHHTRDRKYLRFLVDHVLGYIAAYPIADFVGRSSKTGWVSHTTVAKPWYWCMLSEHLAAWQAFWSVSTGSPARAAQEIVVARAGVQPDVGEAIARVHRSDVRPLGLR